MAVATPSDELYDKVRGLNVRRNQDWGRLAASVVPSVAAGLNGGDPSAVARSFYPDYAKGPNQLQVAGFKKDLVDAAVKAQQSDQKERAGIVE